MRTGNHNQTEGKIKQDTIVSNESKTGTNKILYIFLLSIAAHSLDKNLSLVANQRLRQLLLSHSHFQSTNPQSSQIGLRLLGNGGIRPKLAQGKSGV